MEPYIHGRVLVDHTIKGCHLKYHLVLHFLVLPYFLLLGTITRSLHYTISVYVSMEALFKIKALFRTVLAERFNQLGICTFVCHVNFGKENHP